MLSFTENVDLPSKQQLIFSSKDFRFDIRKYRTQTKVSNPPANDEVKAKNVSVNSVKWISSKKKKDKEKNLPIIQEEAINDRNAVKQEPEKKKNTNEKNLDKAEDEEGICENATLGKQAAI